MAIKITKFSQFDTKPSWNKAKTELILTNKNPSKSPQLKWPQTYKAYSYININ